MQLSQSLLRTACAHVKNVTYRLGSDARAKQVSAVALTQRRFPNPPYILSSLAASRPPLLPRSGDGKAPWSAALVASFQLLHSTSQSASASDTGDKAAAVRRLAAARARRERLTEAASSARAHAPVPSWHPEPSPAQLQQPNQDPTMAITPVERKASEPQLAAALDHKALIVTRPIEWGTVIFGYEQANKYTVYDETGTIVALVAEDFGGLGKELGRQFLRTRRSFTATVFSADGSQVLFRLRRPAYLVSSTMFVEDGEGAVIGEIHQRWHMLKRNYDLYMGKSQFAAISGTFLAWDFELKDASGGTLALVDRNFQGFAKELFTDAGKYVIHFGCKAADQQPQLPAAQLPPPPQQQLTGQALQTAPSQQAAAAGAGTAAAPPPPPVTAMAVARTDVAVIPTMSGNQLVVSRPLDLSERMVALACALTIDYDFFSQHSHSGGLIPPIIPVPMPAPSGAAPPEAAASGVEGGQPGQAVPGAAAAGAAGGTIDGVPLGGEGSGAAVPGGFGTGQVASGDEGFRFDDGIGSEKSWGKGWGEGEMKWDLPGAVGGDGDGEEGGKGVVGWLLGALWALLGWD